MIFNKVRNFKNDKIDGTTTAAEQTDYLVLYLLDALKRDVDGDVVEFGCYIGETSKYLKKCLLEWHSTKKLWVYDSFEGLPPLGTYEEGTGWTEGGFKTTEDILINNFLTNGIEPPKVVKGWFNKIENKDLPNKVCFAFLDGDFYESIYSSLEKIYDRVSEGGYIFFHDYERPDLPGVKAAIEDYFAINGGQYQVLKITNQLAVIKKAFNQCPILTIPKANLTVVTGLWNIGRDERHFEDHYLHNLKLLLEAPCNLFIYIEAKYEHIIWEKRGRENTFVKIYELEDVKQLYSPFWDQTQKIRTSSEWQNLTGEGGWLKGSPQARLEYYNPVVQSKMFMMHDVTIWNPFNTKYFMWVDAGLTNTVPQSLLTSETFYTNITKHLDPFLFLSFDYDSKTEEVHGMKRAYVNKYAGEEMGFVCRGGMFGGSKLAIHYAHQSYYGLLEASLKEGVMGTEETLFGIMSCLRPNYFRRFELPGTIISPFLEAVISGNVPVTGQNILNKEYHEIRNRTAIYFLTFNKPDQLEMTLKHLYRWNADWGTVIHKYVIDNTPDGNVREQNKKVCDNYGFVHIPMMKNIGINGGRQYVAEHFDALDIDYYVFFEDDMTLNGDDLKNEYCRNGFRRYVPNLWDTIHGIMAKEELDFLKLTFQEYFMDNQEQVSWYNVNNDVRNAVWPYYNKLPVTGFDPNCPRTEYDYINVFNGTAYAVGQPYYCNWPLLFSKAGNKKVFLDVKFEHPHERTQMAFVFERQHRGEIKAAVLLASTITHDRKFYYEAEDRKEG